MRKKSVKFISQFFKNWKDKSDRFDLKTSVVLLKIFEIGKIFNKTLKASKACGASEAIEAEQVFQPGD